MGMSTIDPDILARIESLPPKAKNELYRRIQAQSAGNHQVWYCRVGRTCDGRAHEGAPYPHAQDYQWPPPGISWDVWFMMCGRGTGKTRTGSNWTRRAKDKVPRIAIVARRGPDVRQTLIEGPSGLIRACELAGETYDWKPALKEFTFQNGAKAFGYSAEEPDSLRGPEHGAAWLDEPCHMAYIEDVWDNLQLGLRVAGLPGGAKVLLTSSPLPNKWTRERVKDDRTVLVQVPTSRNEHNLDESYRRRVIDPLRGTRKGRQELEAQLLEDVVGALWKDSLLIREAFELEDLGRRLVAVDPAGSTGKRSDETGIISGGLLGERFGIVRDRSGKYSPHGWAMEAIREYERINADAIVVERNFGADMVRDNVRNAGFKGRIIEVRASHGKEVRAEPIVGLYEQGRVLHQEGADLADLEDEQLTWVPGVGASPNRVDALVWLLTELNGKGTGETSTGIPRGQLGGPKRPKLPWTGRR
jgi:phage terminase large subunit-like protein